MRSKGLRLVAICGWCSKIDKYPATLKDFGWVFLKRYKRQEVNAWFCSEKCLNKQVKRWDKKR